VSIVRVGLAETRNFAEGYDAIFSNKKQSSPVSKPAKKAAAKGSKASSAKKKKPAKKK
jgi:hypothetical protein